MQAVLRITNLPEPAVEAAAVYYSEWLDRVLGECARGSQSVALLLPAASYDHSDWRRAAVRDLARRVAPVRINMVAGGDPAAVDAALSYLAAARAITGQVLELAETVPGDKA